MAYQNLVAGIATGTNKNFGQYGRRHHCKLIRLRENAVNPLQ